MTKTKKVQSIKSGLPPGALVHVGSRKAKEIKITHINYNSDSYDEEIVTDVNSLAGFQGKDKVNWINIDGLHDINVIDSIGKVFNLHPLLLEDVLNTHHRPKIEVEEDTHIFITLKMLGVNKRANGIITEQISFVIGDGWLLTFQEKEGDLFDSIRHRIKEKIGNVRDKSTSYLLYRLMDSIVDNYFFVTEMMSDISEKLEERVLENSDQHTLKEIQTLKHQLIQLRKSINPLREVLSALSREAQTLIEQDSLVYFRDVYEHVIQANETIEMQRDIVASIMDLQLSGMSNKMNEVMKLLTIISTIFIPITFIAGIYGMNFTNLPETQWEYGYFYVWGLMLVMAILMIIYFRRKKWL